MHNVNPPNKTAQHVQQKVKKKLEIFLFRFLYGQEVYISLRLYKNNEVRVFFSSSLRTIIYISHNIPCDYVNDL